MSSRQEGYATLLNQLAVLVKTAQIHDVDNIAFQESLSRFCRSLNSLVTEFGGLTIQLAGEFLYLNDERVRYPISLHMNFDFLTREFKKRNLGEVYVPKTVEASVIALFISSFIKAGFEADPMASLKAAIKPTPIVVDELKKVLEEETGDGEDKDPRRLVKKTYFNAVAYTKGIAAKMKAGEKVNFRKAKRLVESVVDQLIEEETLLVGMTAIKDYDEYTYHHSVNVSILAIALGQRIGLSKRSLTELGMAALFHDIGKIEVPPEILNKPSSFTTDEWEIVKRHPSWGARAVLRLKGIDVTSMRTAVAAFEHHLQFDGKGYPAVKQPLAQDLFSEIITVADQYDAMTSSRVYARVPLPPDRALSLLIERAGTQVNPTLAKVFVNLTGVYPQGSLVLLSTREMALVFEANPNPELIDRPRIIIIIDSAGKETGGVTVDLAEKDAAGNFKRSIIRTLDPNKYNINLSEFLL